MSFLSNNIAAILVAVTVSALGWIYGGTRGDLVNPVLPWLTVLMLEISIAFPQRHRDESMFDARERVWSSLKGDPFVWTSLALILLLAVPFVNRSLCVGCDAELVATGASPTPPVQFLPFCFDRMEHLNVFLWFAASLSAATVVRHCLTQSGRRMVLAMIVWNGFALAVLGFLQHALDAPGPLWNGETGLPRVRGIQVGMADFFSTFGYSNMAGCYFVLLFGIAVAMWRDTARRMQLEYDMKDISNAADKPPHLFWRGNYYLIPSAVFFYSALYSMSRSAIILASACAAIYIVHAFVTHLSHLRSKLEKVRAFMVGVFVICALVFVATVFMPEKVIKEASSLDTVDTLDRVSGRTDETKRAAMEIWRENALFGCGGWGFVHLSEQKRSEDAAAGKKRKKATLPIVGGINVHNDYIQFLAEHGTIGFGLLVAAVVMLFWPVGRTWRELLKRTRFMKKQDLPARPVAIFVLPAPVFCMIVASLCALIHAFGDCPFRSPAIMTLFFVSLAAMQGFLPKKG